MAASASKAEAAAWPRKLGGVAAKKKNSIGVESVWRLASAKTLALRGAMKAQSRRAAAKMKVKKPHQR
jgi:hypothetical protein